MMGKPPGTAIRRDQTPPRQGAASERHDDGTQACRATHDDARTGAIRIDNEQTADYVRTWYASLARHHPRKTARHGDYDSIRDFSAEMSRQRTQVHAQRVTSSPRDTHRRKRDTWNTTRHGTPTAAPPHRQARHSRTPQPRIA